LWEWSIEWRKYFWMTWDKVYLLIEMGGLGVRDISIFNSAFIAKWKWRLGSEYGRGWKEVIESIYGDWRNMRNSMIDRRSSNWWKDLEIINEVNKESNWFDQRIRWHLGNGSEIKFWEDWWVGDGSLQGKFPRLFGISSLKDGTVKDFGLQIGHGTPHTFMWQISWRRDLFEWEKVLEKQLLELINNALWNGDMPD